MKKSFLSCLLLVSLLPTIAFGFVDTKVTSAQTQNIQQQELLLQIISLLQMQLAQLQKQSTEISISKAAFYVSPTGSDSNSGTSVTSPFKTLVKAQEEMRESDTKTTYLLGGEYTDTFPLTLDEADGGQSWLSYQGQIPILEGKGTSDSAVYIGGDNIKISGLTIQNFKRKGIEAVDVRNTVINNNTFYNIAADDWNQAAIKFSGDFINGKITHNLIKGTGYAGIQGNFVKGDDYSGLLIDSNAIFDTMRTVRDGGAIYIMDRGQSRATATVSNNVIGNYGNTRPIIEKNGKWNLSIGIYLDDLMSNVTVKNNVVYGKGHYGIHFHSGDSNVVENNIFDLSEGTKLGSYDDSSGKGNTFTCNIVYSNAAVTADPLWDSYENADSFKISNNNYWNPKGKLPNSGAVVDSNPSYTDPRFVNATKHNYNFLAGAPLSCFKSINTSQSGPLDR